MLAFAIPTKPQQEDSFNFWVPLADELTKAIEVDENGDYIIQGLMTSDARDEESDEIDPEGADCSYFLEKGWIKYEHGNSPDQYIGEPLEVKIGKFLHPTLKQAVYGILVKGRLFAQRSLTQKAVRAIQDLSKSNTKRRMGLSIEGQAVERCRETGKVVKSIIRNVVLTMNPVNTTTWVELAKSFSADHKTVVAMEKAMDIEATEALRTQSIEDYNPEEDPQEQWVKAFREFVDKSFEKSFFSGMVALALYKGMPHDKAHIFATYMDSKQDILKSLLPNGGEQMKTEDLMNLLDSDIEELKKSLEREDTEDEEYTEDEEDTEDTEDEEEDEEDEEDEGFEKGLKTSFAKSFASDEDNAHALEVSDFLANLVDNLGFQLDGFAKSLMHSMKQQNTITKSLASVMDVVKSMATELDSLASENRDLKKSLEDVLQRPLGRRSVVSAKEVETLKKGINHNANKQGLTQAQALDILMKSFEAGELDGGAIARFEAGIPLAKLNLPDKVKEELGL